METLTVALITLSIVTSICGLGVAYIIKLSDDKLSKI